MTQYFLNKELVTQIDLSLMQYKGLSVLPIFFHLKCIMDIFPWQYI